MNFNELNIRDEILRAISDLGYTEATDIQGAAIPSILEGRDVTGRSSTGTGKTAAFGIPVVQQTAENPEKASVLILAPTRELALQITEELRKYAKYLSGVSMAAIYGGDSMEKQIKALKNAKIVVGTPGRVMDHMRRKTLRLNNLRTIVLDEADEMLNMGFIDDIRTILESVPQEHQTILFSATLPPQIMQITEDFQTETVVVKADKGQKTTTNIKQRFYNVPKERKNDALFLLLRYHRPKRALVFCNTKTMVDELTLILQENGFSAAALHGDLRQTQRNTVMRDFKIGQASVLVATDVAARGIDVDDVESVFNYDIPQEMEYYIHRIGRTGRAGKTGFSHTLVTNRKQLIQLKAIERYINMPIKEKPVPTNGAIQAVRIAAMGELVDKCLQEKIDPRYIKLIDQMADGGYSPSVIAASLLQHIQGESGGDSEIEDIPPIVFDAPIRRRGSFREDHFFGPGREDRGPSRRRRDDHEDRKKHSEKSREDYAKKNGRKPKHFEDKKDRKGFFGKKHK